MELWGMQSSEHAEYSAGIKGVKTERLCDGICERYHFVYLAFCFFNIQGCMMKLKMVIASLMILIFEILVNISTV